MKVIIDIEANALVNPTQIWLIVCKCVETGEYFTFRNLTSDDTERTRFLNFDSGVDQWIGHNLLGYDCLVIDTLLGLDLTGKALDTLVLSKLIDYPRVGHSIESYGLEFNIEKGDFHKWNDPDLYDSSSELFALLETYCLRDVDICHKVYLKYLKYLSKEEHKASIDLEHKFQLVVNTLSKNGFSFNKVKAESLLKKVEEELKVLDKEILKSFPPKLKLIKEVNPKVTLHGTLSKVDFRGEVDLSIYNGGPFCRCSWAEFNPSSHKQLIEVLNNAGWVPFEKTQTHIDAEREHQKLRYTKRKTAELDTRLTSVILKLKSLEKSGWKINEANLSTLPTSAPASARTLAKRILYESRRRTLTEWLNLVQDDGRIHGKFYGIGAWTHRMAHQAPNTANIPNELDTQGVKKLLGKELRSLWQAPKKRLLVGVDAEGIQLRVFAHYIDDQEFTDALVNGRKANKTDPHSLNQRILGSVCKSRQAAKRFIYALLLGAGLQKLAAILECSEQEAKTALDRLLGRYAGWQRLKEEVFPNDAARGYITGLDGRKVRIPGDTAGNRKHLCMSGYLQNGESVVMKLATLKWHSWLKQEGSLLVNMVHDEWQTETPNNLEQALRVAEAQSRSLREVGEDLKLKCPLAGSYYNDDIKDYTIATNWSKTH